MKRIILSGLSVILSISFLFGNFDYLPRLYTIKTKYFDIIYSENSRETAFYIASFADETFEKLQAMLKSKHKKRFKVIVSGDVQEANGYASVTPAYTTIAIFNVLPPLDSTVANSKEFFKMEFLHELTHAISLNIRNDFLEFMADVFGNWMWGGSSMPLSMMEGITVSFESMEGEGRLNYPLIKEEIQQDIYEKKFRTPSQANGSYDNYLSRHNFYHYGGYFSYYLQQKYGIEKYVELWKATLGSPIAGIGGAFFINSSLWSFISPIDQLKPIVGLAPLAVENVFCYPLAFYQVYKTPIEKEWKEFKEFMKYKGELEENTNNITPPQNYNIEYPVRSDDKLYFIDHFNEGIVEMELKGRKQRYIFLGEGINSISISKDGQTLLVCRTKYKDRKNGITKIFARKFDIKKRRFYGKKYYGIREAAFFNGEIIGINIRKHFTDLVLIKEDGRMETLIQGNENLILGNPLQLNDKEILFLANDNGEMKIGRINVLTREINVAKMNIKFLRNISVYENRVFFSYNTGEGFYKLGYIDLDNKKLYLDERNFSGGVFYPIPYENKIYYVGKFADGDTILSLPQNKLKESEISWLKNEFKSDRTAELISQFKSKEKSYSPFFDLLPSAWIPYLSFQDENLTKGLDGAGLMMYMADPYGFNTLRLALVYNYLLYFPNIELNWECSALPIHFEIGAVDKLIYFDDINIYSTPDVVPYYNRYTGAYLNFWHVINFDEPNQYLKIGEEVAYNQLLIDNDYLTNKILSDSYLYTSPYQWYFAYSRYLTFTTYFKLAGYTMYHPYKFYDGNRGFEINGFFDYYYSLTNNIGIYTNIYKIEAQMEYYFYYLPLVLKISGGYSPESSFRLSKNRRFIYNRYLRMYEYDDLKDSSMWYGAFDMSLRLLNLEIQQGISFIPFLFLNRFYITAGYRGGYIESGYYHTPYIRANLVIPMLGGSGGLSLYKMIIYVEGNYAINKERFGYEWRIDFGKQFIIE